MRWEPRHFGLHIGTASWELVKMLVESATSRDGHVEVVEYLLDLSVLDVDERDNGVEVVRVLVEKGGVDLDVRVWESDPGAGGSGCVEWCTQGPRLGVCGRRV